MDWRITRAGVAIGLTVGLALSVGAQFSKPLSKDPLAKKLLQQLKGPKSQSVGPEVVKMGKRGMLALCHALEFSDWPSGDLTNPDSQAKEFAKQHAGRRQLVRSMGGPGLHILMQLLASPGMSIDAYSLLTYEGSAGFAAVKHSLPSLHGESFVWGIESLKAIITENPESHFDDQMKQVYTLSLCRSGNDGNIGADQVSNLKQSDAEEIITSLLTDPSPTARLNAARAAIRNKDEDLVPSLIKLLDDPSLAVRRTVAGGIVLLPIQTENRYPLSKALKKLAESKDVSLAASAKHTAKVLGFYWARITLS